ncbi:unnamed protein product [Symbiodinium sp. CCMP2456]|nr:unnamed protein product [Symbiodinium sp. CCMP2456]
MPTAKFPKGHVDGLSDRLANDPVLRSLILNQGTLLKWSCPKLTGVVGVKSLRMNADLMIAVGSVLCPQSSTPLGLVVGPIKKQVKALRAHLKLEADTEVDRICKFYKGYWPSATAEEDAHDDGAPDEGDHMDEEGGEEEEAEEDECIEEITDGAGDDDDDDDDDAMNDAELARRLSSNARASKAPVLSPKVAPVALPAPATQVAGTCDEKPQLEMPSMSREERKRRIAELKNKIKLAAEKKEQVLPLHPVEEGFGVGGHPPSIKKPVVSEGKAPRPPATPQQALPLVPKPDAVPGGQAHQATVAESTAQVVAPDQLETQILEDVFDLEVPLTRKEQLGVKAKFAEDKPRGRGRGRGRGSMKRPAAATAASKLESRAPEQPESSLPETKPKTKRARTNEPETKQGQEKDTKELQQSSKPQTDDQEDASIPKANKGKTDDQEDASIPKANKGKPDRKPKAKAKAKAEANQGKPDRKPKAKAKAKSKKADPDEAPCQKQTFARRNQPPTEVGFAKWSGLRRIFEEHDHFWKFFSSWYQGHSFGNAQTDIYANRALEILHHYFGEADVKENMRD